MRIMEFENSGDTGAEHSDRSAFRSDPLKPYQFPKGKSGNPGGRPKKSYDFGAMCREYTDEALAQIISIARDEDQPSIVRLDAWRTILVYGHGKPIARLEAELVLKPKIEGLPLYQQAPMR